jgi:hypothetical protein
VFWFAGGTDPDCYARAKEAGRLNEFFAVSRMRAQGEKIRSPEISSDHIRVEFRRKLTQARRDSLPPYKDALQRYDRAS